MLKYLKPSVPQFTLKYVDHSYDVPPTYSKDQYTGNTVMTQAGYHIENKSLEITITNQQFAPYKDANGNTVNFYYDIRWKGRFGDYWADFNSSISLLASSNQSSSVYTIALGDNSRYGSDFVYSITDTSEGGQIDFQVQAYVGYYIKVDENITDPAAIAFHHNEGFYYYSFIGQSSDWSPTQTFTIPASSNSSTTTPTIPNYGPTSSPTPTPSVPEFSWLAIIPLMISMLSVAIAFRRHRKTANFNQ